MGQASTNFGNTAETVGTDAVRIARAQFDRKNLRVKNTHATQDLYVGGTDQVTSSDGWPIPAGEQEMFENFDGDLWAVASGADTTVIVVAFS